MTPPNNSTVIVETLLPEDRRVLLFGPPGAGKSTLMVELARVLLSAGRKCHCISADPGTPPGTVGLGEWSDGGWQVTAWEPLCTLDAGRFRLPLVSAVRRLAQRCEEGVLLLDSPGVARGVAGSELLVALVEAASIDVVLVLAIEDRPLPLAETLQALGKEACLVPAARNAKRPGKRARAKARTQQWDAYLTNATTIYLGLEATKFIGTPPPAEQEAAWAGRQVALLSGGQAEAMAEVVRLEDGRLTLLTPLEMITADSLLVRDAQRGASGLLETAEPFASEPVAYLPPGGPSGGRSGRGRAACCGARRSH